MKRKRTGLTFIIIGLLFITRQGLISWLGIILGIRGIYLFMVNDKQEN